MTTISGAGAAKQLPPLIDPKPSTRIKGTKPADSTPSAPKPGDKDRGDKLKDLLERPDRTIKTHGKDAIKHLKGQLATQGDGAFMNPKVGPLVKERLEDLGTYERRRPPAPDPLTPAVFDPAKPGDDIDPDVLEAIKNSPRAQYARMLELAGAIGGIVGGVQAAVGAAGAATDAIIGAVAGGIAMASSGAPASQGDDDDSHGGRRPPG